MSHSYALNPLNQILTHARLPFWTVRDGLDGLENINPLDIQVISGDYFVTLATTLDSLSQPLAELNNPAADHLQDIVSDLLYLQQHYKIERKKR